MRSTEPLLVIVLPFAVIVGVGLAVAFLAQLADRRAAWFAAPARRASIAAAVVFALSAPLCAWLAGGVADGALGFYRARGQGGRIELAAARGVERAGQFRGTAPLLGVAVVGLLVPVQLGRRTRATAAAYALAAASAWLGLAALAATAQLPHAGRPAGVRDACAWPVMLGPGHGLLASGVAWLTLTLAASCVGMALLGLQAFLQEQLDLPRDERRHVEALRVFVLALLPAAFAGVLGVALASLPQLFGQPPPQGPPLLPAGPALALTLAGGTFAATAAMRARRARAADERLAADDVA